MGPDACGDVDAASMRRTSLAPNDAGVFVGVLSSSPVTVTMRDIEESAAAVSSVCAFCNASLFLLLRRRSLAAFLALFFAFSILLCLLPEGRSAEGTAEGAETDGEAAASPLARDGTGLALGKTSGGAVVDSPFLLLLLRPLAASGSFLVTEAFPVSDAVAGVERTLVAAELEADERTSPGVA